MELFSLLASLPELTLFEQPGITHEKFLFFCSSYFHGKRLELLEKLSLRPDPDDPEIREMLRPFPEHSVPRAFSRWEAALRNSLAKIRSAKNPGRGSAERLGAGYETDADTAARQAYAAPDPLERERILDRARWEKLSELARTGHSHAFTFDTVCAYSLKLRIAEKWTARKEAEAASHLDRAAEAVRASGRAELKEVHDKQEIR